MWSQQLNLLGAIQLQCRTANAFSVARPLKCFCSICEPKAKNFKNISGIFGVGLILTRSRRRIVHSRAFSLACAFLSQKKAKSKAKEKKKGQTEMLRMCGGSMMHNKKFIVINRLSMMVWFYFLHCVAFFAEVLCRELFAICKATDV